MSDIICVTDRRLCREDIVDRIRLLAEAGPRAVILREKDLAPAAYRGLAEQALAICAEYGVPCVLHSFADVAAELGAKALHLPLPVLRELTAEQRAAFPVLGASCHSVEEAVEAEALGCTYITAGHIFETGCKQGLPGRGLDFLREVCHAVSIPVYAIGGVSPANIAAVRAAGAAGGCSMSGAMTCDDPAAYLAAFEDNKNEAH